MKVETKLYAALSLILLFPTIALAGLSGALDKHFHLDGKLTVAGTSMASIYDVAVQPDGKIVAVGTLDEDFLVLRFNPDGTPDATFDGDGKVTTDFGGSQDYAYTVKIMPNGRILVGGSAFMPVTGQDYALARYTPTGALEPNLDLDGKLTIDFGATTYESIAEILVQSDGRYVLAGRTWTGTSQADFSAARILVDGTLDTSFDGDGKFAIAMTSGLDILTTAAIQSNDRIILAGVSNNDFCLVRLLANGSLDTNFDTDGIVTTDFFGLGDTLNSIVIQPDGRTVACGSITITGTERDFGCARYLTTGALNNTFDGDGMMTVSLSTGTVDQIWDMVLQSDGKIVAVGSVKPNADNDIGLIRINPDGSLDNSFDGDGKTWTDINGTSDIAFAVALQPNGQIVVGGTASTSNVYGALLRYNSRNINAPFDFDGDDKADIGVFRPSAGEWWINRSSSTVLAAQFGASTDKFVPGDFTGDGKTDMAFWRPSTGFWYVLRSDDFSYFAFPFGASGDTPVPADYDADGKVDPAVFRPSTATWYISRSSDGATTILAFGASTDKPVVDDYDGDAKADIAVFRPSDASWWILRSSDGASRAFQFGNPTDKPVQGDWTGDDKADIAVFRPSTGFWLVMRSEDNNYYAVPFGSAGDLPAPGDFDGDGRFDTAVFRPSSAVWFINRSTAGQYAAGFGANGDSPVESAYIP